MEMRLLGNTGVYVSKLCLGTMTFGDNQWGVGNLGEREVTEMVHAALDAGINFFDTADVYAYGQSEELLGKALGSRRKDVILATKVRMRMSGDPNHVGLSRHHILNSVDASLRRLKTDYIDLYQVHLWDHLTPLEETLRALDDLVRWGKVRYIGASNYAAWHMMKALWISDKHHYVAFQSYQGLYNLLHRDIETEIVPMCDDRNLSILAWSPLAGGLLTGKHRPGAEPPSDSRLSGPMGGFLPVDEKRLATILATLEEVAGRHDVPMAAVALAWLLRKPRVTSVIVGARRMDQLKQNLAAAELELTDDDMQQLDEASFHWLPYPQWMILRVGKDR
ncbi:aldo/keto reductase [Thermostilla marina]